MVSTFYIFSHKTEFSKAEILASLVSLAYSQVKKAALPATWPFPKRDLENKLHQKYKIVGNKRVKPPETACPC